MKKSESNSIYVYIFLDLFFPLKGVSLFSLEEYTKKRDGYATDLEQFHDLIQQMDEHVSALKQKKKDRAHELEETIAS